MSAPRLADPCTECGTWLETRALDPAGRCAECVLEAEMIALAEEDAAALQAAVRVEIGWCTHCHADPAAYADGTCRACRAYWRKTGNLPSDEVLRRRCERRVDRHLAQSACRSEDGLRARGE